MIKREGLSKKIRFEIFKRDKFICQYCGAKSPEVILNVDHINPVAKGGKNETLNLITSCFDCNSGKSDRILNDSSILEKQRKQLENLQERREQIELMLEWKKSLSNFDNDISEMITEYVESKMKPYILNENGKKSISELSKKFEVGKILDAIDISANKYIKYGNEELEKESIEDFVNKISGIVYVQGLSPIKQKLAYIKGIARNRFYWDDKIGSIILSNYLKQLEKHYNEEQILADLENEVIKLTKEAKNWSEWRNTLENWTSHIENQWGIESEPEQKNISNSEKEYTTEYLESIAYNNSCDQEDSIKAVEHIAKIFPKFTKSKFRKLLKKHLLDFIKTKNDFENGATERTDAREFIDKYIQESEIINLFDIDYQNDNINLGILIVLEPKILEIITEIFMFFYFPVWGMKKEYLKIIIEIHIKELTVKK
ncbi:HNH endonuclease [Flavobacterium crassostreae]|uniref:HNH endonuclease n=1 Tax=Flavobacterium crassostreae TaxID=1763534 RepID=UPI000832B2C0|nr:HNH endonuclease [Flavobacterium crassostreae]